MEVAEMVDPAAVMEGKSSTFSLFRSRLQSAVQVPFDRTKTNISQSL